MELFPLKPVTIIVGHYGVGKTNLSLNLSIDAALKGQRVTLVDLDVVNPYFRSSDYTEMLKTHNVEVIAPVFAGKTLDNPSISGEISVALRAACPESCVIIDAGGDDVGSTALGRFAKEIEDFDMYYVVNAYRNLTQRAHEAADLLSEIESKTHLKANGVINNSHLQNETTIETVKDSVSFAEEISTITNLSLVCTTVPKLLVEQKSELDFLKNVYPVNRYVRTSWDR